VAEQAESIDNPLHEAAKRGKYDWGSSCVMLKDDWFVFSQNNDIFRMKTSYLFWLSAILIKLSGKFCSFQKLSWFTAWWNCHSAIVYTEKEFGTTHLTT